jgi:hypothetical protein
MPEYTRRQHNESRGPHLKDEADDGCPGLQESRELEPVLLQHVVPAAQVEAEPALGREIHGTRHRSCTRRGTATHQGHGESNRIATGRSGVRSKYKSLAGFHGARSRKGKEEGRRRYLVDGWMDGCSSQLR